MAEDDPRDQILAAFHDRRAVTPRWICEVCATLVPVSGASIVQMSNVNRQETVCATNEVAQGLATLQFTLGEGPAVHAAGTGRPVLVSNLHEVDHPSWPMFAEATSRTPARALYCFPLRIGALRVGVLSLYRDQPGPLSTAELAGALLCADLARGALLDLRAPDPRWPSRSGG
jgi:GAF domain-containing protein